MVRDIVTINPTAINHFIKNLLSVFCSFKTILYDGSIPLNSIRCIP